MILNSTYVCMFWSLVLVPCGFICLKMDWSVLLQVSVQCSAVSHILLHYLTCSFLSVAYSGKMDTLSDLYVHLTNYSINKNSEGYVPNEEPNTCQGHKWYKSETLFKWSLTFLSKLLCLIVVQDIKELVEISESARSGRWGGQSFHKRHCD